MCGLVVGSVVGAAVTAIIFLLTLFRTPMHIYKMLRVTATTDKCFKGRSGRVLRPFVFVLVPIPHVVFLLGVTTFAGSVGLMFYIGKTTKVLYNHEYKKTLKQAGSNARLEPKSHLGKYVKSCQDFMEDDTASHPTIYFLKWCCAGVPGVLLGSIPFVPFTIIIVFITVMRLPINMYKTMKIALFTVVLNLDLRILALVTLPVVHVLFPVVVLVVTIVGSFGHFVWRTWKNIYKGKSPFHKWDTFKTGIEKYHRMHREFVGDMCGEYDHPTGIPNGWRGDSYGIPVVTILRWQRDFLLRLIFALYGFCISLSGSVALSVCKVVPSFFYMWYEITKDYADQSAVKMMGTWPFYLAGLCLAPVVVVIFYAGLIVASIFMGALKVPWEYTGFNCRAAFYEPLMVIKALDKCTWWCSGRWAVFQCLAEKTNPYTNDWSNQRHRETADEAQQRSGAYWDRLVSQCIKTTSDLLRTGWIAPGDVQSLDPAVIQSIPGVAVLTIPADTVREKDLDEEDIKWNVDGTVCKRKDRPVNDGIVNLLWPLAFEVKKMLAANDCKLAGSDNVRAISAMICSNGEEDTDVLQKFMEEEKAGRDQSYKSNNKIRTKINELVSRICRTKPYQDRMESIFSFDFESACEESGVEAGTMVNDESPGGCNSKVVAEKLPIESVAMETSPTAVGSVTVNEQDPGGCDGEVVAETPPFANNISSKEENESPGDSAVVTETSRNITSCK